ncbi:MAG: hypothetical protein DI585_05570 [Pseudomonas fluorescens]|nr:MAG: hypothetical protein DI585_05570 [Pseudomonas fluorescens]
MHRIACRTLATILGLYVTLFTLSFWNIIPVILGFFTMYITYSIIGIVTSTPQERQILRRWNKKQTPQSADNATQAHVCCIGLALCVTGAIYNLGYPKELSYLLSIYIYIKASQLVKKRYSIP